MNINELRDKIHSNAIDNGWWDEERNFGELLMLCVSELSEALEEFRVGEQINQIYHSIDKNGNRKIEGIPSELADTIIRCLDICGAYDINIEKVINEKLEYNKTRGYKHGNKKC